MRRFPDLECPVVAVSWDPLAVGPLAVGAVPSRAARSVVGAVPLRVVPSAAARSAAFAVRSAVGRSAAVRSAAFTVRSAAARSVAVTVASDTASGDFGPGFGPADGRKIGHRGEY